MPKQNAAVLPTILEAGFAWVSRKAGLKSARKHDWKGDHADRFIEAAARTGARRGREAKIVKAIQSAIAAGEKNS